ncbi:MAG TPA: putative toxin-antitoxin system toxin component, PIN family [Actinomycetota bacterium]
MRIVLDTNVLISAILFPGGPPEDVLRLAIEGRVELVTSATLLTEYARVLTEKFGHSEGQASERVRRIVAIAKIVKPHERVEEVAEDPEDDRVLEAALASEANVIVSGDKHLLRLGSWRGIRVQRPAEFLAEFESH